MTENATVALGVRDLSGRDLTGQAVLVTLRLDDDGSGPARPVAVDRREVDVAGAGLPARVFHAAATLSTDDAARLVDDARRAAEHLARRELAGYLTDMRAAGHTVDVVALPLDEPADAGATDVAATPLPDILASHTSIHAAEAHLYREALVAAAAEHGVTVFRYVPRSLPSVTANSVRLTPAELTDQLGAWGRSVGRPWRKDHQAAALAAWLAIASG